MTSEPHTDLMNDAYTLGEQHGRAAGSWVIDGNTTRETAQAVLSGYEDGDPLVMDMQPSPLSGEWADSMTPQRLMVEMGLDPSTTYPPESGMHEDDICDAYEQGFSDAYWATVIADAQNVVG